MWVTSSTLGYQEALQARYTVQSFAAQRAGDIPSKLGRTVALADPVGENRIPLHFGYLPKGVVGSCIHCYFLGNYCL